MRFFTAAIAAILLASGADARRCRRNRASQCDSVTRYAECKFRKNLTVDPASVAVVQPGGMVLIEQSTFGGPNTYHVRLDKLTASIGYNLNFY